MPGNSGQRYPFSSGAGRGAVEGRAGRHGPVRGRRRHGTGTTELGQTSLQLDVEAAVEDRVDGTVQQRQRAHPSDEI